MIGQMGKKIVVITNNSGGLCDFRGMLLSEFIKRGDTVTALTPYDTKVDELKAMGVILVNTPLNRRGMNPDEDLKLLRIYKEILKKLQPDLVITYTIKPNVYGGFVCRQMKISYAANITGLGTTFQNDGMLKKLVTIMYKVGLRKAKTVFFENCENQQVFISNGIVKEEQTCLLNGAGVDLEHFQIAEYPGGEHVKFLFIGRVMKEKGIDELFEAMRKLRADGVNCSLDVLGSYEEDYKTQIEQYEAEGWLHYHGYQLDVRPFIAASHCFVLPSWHEGMANTNLECAASGRPVITSNIHGCLEAVEDGVTGYLCTQKNADHLYKVMKSFIMLSYEERMKMGMAGRKRMEEVFDKKKVVKRTIEKL